LTSSVSDKLAEITSPHYLANDSIGLCSVLRPHQHSIGYTGDGFYRSKDPTNSIKVMKEKAVNLKVAVLDKII